MQGMAPPWTRIILFACLALSASSCGSKGSCPSGQVLCGGVCTDPGSYQTDANNCGACGVTCGASGTCSGGLCQCAGTSRCDALIPRCRDLKTDITACGSCTNVCTRPGESCANGVCQCAPKTDCGTYCANTQTDALNCGTCGHVCPRPGESCGGGTCLCLAPKPNDCTTYCTNTQTDPQNCAGCGIACKPAASCAAGTCQCLAPNPDDCGALCTNRQTDPQNCGTCGRVCIATGQTCVSGNCQCPQGQSVCGSACVPCPPSAVCVSNACQCPKGPVAGCSGTCCPGGTQCCGNGACQTQHSNGLGQSYFDCNPLYSPAQTTLAAATAAAKAWNDGPVTSSSTCGDPYCVARQTSTQCAVWCYGISNFAGRVGLNTTNAICICPTGMSPNWN